MSDSGTPVLGAPAPVRIARLAAEFALLYLGIPVAYHAGLVPVHIFAIMLPAAVICFCLLRQDGAFPKPQLWNIGAVDRRGFVTILVTFAIAAGVLAAILAVTDRGALFGLLRHNPKFWLLIMVIYPLISVYPQEVIYRAFLFHRYAVLFPTPVVRVAVSALTFGLVHIVFNNSVAVLLTLGGGVLFALTYTRTRSLACVWLEHALYGWFIFTIGLGRFFLTGTADLAARMLR